MAHWTAPLVLACLSAAGDPLPADVDRIATDALAAWRVPGMAVAVVRPGGESVKGYGVKRAGSPEPVTADTVFPLASCTKAVTSTLVAMLADDGLLGWDDPVRRHLPTFHLSEPHADALVTVRDLLAHRTGVRGHDLVWYRAPWDRAECLRRIAHLPVDRPFRGAYEYSTLMVMAAGEAAAARADRPWHELVRERITGPLGMTGVTFTTTDPAFLAADRATGHRPNKAGEPEPTEWYPSAEPNPAGSVNLSARAMLPWLRFHLANGEHAGRRLVSAANLAEIRTPHVPVPMSADLRRFHPDTVQMSYGMGWLVYDYRGRRVAGHSGLIDGFRVQVTLLPDDGIGVAVFNNRHASRVNQVVTNAVVDRLLGLPAKDWNAILLAADRADDAAKAAAAAGRARARRADVPPTLPLERYAGRYADPAYGTGRISVADGRLVWEWSSFRAPLEHWEGDLFRVPDGFLEDQFVEFRVTPTGPDALRFVDTVFMKR